MAEVGLPNVAAEAWNGFCGPANMPEAVVKKLHDGINAAVRAPDVAKRIADLGNIIVGSSPEDFRKFMLAEQAKYARVAQASGAKPE
jgi:tripartite-type tricarboxylate transporter receptor subunit TctC